MNAPTPAILADTLPPPSNAARIEYRAKVNRLADRMAALDPFSPRWHAAHSELIKIEKTLSYIEQRATWPPAAHATRAERECVIGHAAQMSQAEADRLTDRLYTESGLAWLRSRGWTSGRRHPGTEVGTSEVSP